MADTCQFEAGESCTNEAEHAVWTTRTVKTGEVRTSVQWAYWMDEKQPPKKADLLCGKHTRALLSGLANTMGGSQ